MAERGLQRGSLDQIVEQGHLARDPAARERGKDLVKEFVAQVLEGSMTVTRDAETMINARIAQIDHLLSIQLNEILHHPSFQKLERSWRGLKYLMDQSMTVIELPDEQVAALRAKAAAAGLSLEAWLEKLVASEVAGQKPDQTSIVHLQGSNPKEWARQFRTWADGHDPALPVLSDAAMSRESIYPDLT